MGVKEDIINAKKIIEGIGIKKYNQIFHSNSAIYKFTNENISGYYDLLNLKDKKMLTVCSSGDHVLEAILKDIKKVDCFDISIFTKYFMYLKLSSVLELDYQEFLNYFFDKDNNDIFNEKYYSRIRKYLKIINIESLLFWNNLYNNYKGKDIYLSSLFEKNYLGKQLYISNKKSYLNKDNYNILKQKLEKYLINNNVLFYHTNIINLDNIKSSKYDLIILSNISNYINEIYTKDAYIKYYNLILNEIGSLLKENGIVEVAYLYFEKTMQYFVHNCLQNDKFDLLSFDSLTNLKNKKSYILTYKK